MILAFDTSSRWMSVSLYDGVNVLSEVVWHASDYHTAQLAPVAEEVLRRAGIQPADLKAVGVALGPGGYTGLRVGLAFAKGLAFASHLALVGVPTLDVLAAAQVPPYLQGSGYFPAAAKIWIAAFIQAGRSRFGVGWYRIVDTENAESDKTRYRQESMDVLTMEAFLEEAEKRALEDGSPIYACGEFSQHDRQLMEQRNRTAPEIQLLVASPAQSLRRPGFLAELAWERYLAGQADNPSTLAPIYLH